MAELRDGYQEPRVTCGSHMQMHAGISYAWPRDIIASWAPPMLTGMAQLMTEELTRRAGGGRDINAKYQQQINRTHMA